MENMSRPSPGQRASRCPAFSWLSPLLCFQTLLPPAGTPPPPPGPHSPAGHSSLAPVSRPLACAQHSSPPSLVALRVLEAKCDLPKDRAWSPSSVLPLVEAEPSAVREAKQSPTEKIPQRISVEPFSRRARGLLEKGACEQATPRAPGLVPSLLCASVTHL